VILRNFEGFLMAQVAYFHSTTDFRKTHI